MRLYWEVARRGFRRYSTYVGATLAGLFTNALFGFFRAYIFVAVFASAGSTIGVFGLRDAITFSFFTQAILMAVYLWGWWEISESIRTGDVVTDLFRPYDYQLWWLAQDLGRALYHFLTRGAVMILVGALAFDLKLPSSVLAWGAAIASLALAVLVSFGIRFIANLLTFWVMDHRGTSVILVTIWNVLSGFIVPLTFFPTAVRPVLEALPFAATVQIPAEVFLEKRVGPELVSALAFQAFWGVALLLVGRWVLAIATRRVVTQGG